MLCVVCDSVCGVVFLCVCVVSLYVYVGLCVYVSLCCVSVLSACVSVCVVIVVIGSRPRPPSPPGRDPSRLRKGHP